MIDTSQTDANEMLNDGWSFHRVYQRGLAPPNYPMPAIPIKIDLAQAAHWHAVARAFQAKFAKR